MSNIPLLSVVIATKNREKYCVETIKAILNLNDTRIEIAIADNSATRLVKEYVEELNDNKIKYQYDDSEISSIDNFNKAMSLAGGEYICLLGDDDGLLPNVMEILEWAKKNDIDSICSKQTVIYYWPGALERYPNGYAEVPFFGEKTVEVDTKKELTKLLKSGLQNYLLYSLPKSYHGFVKRDLMQQIKNTTGHFYGGLSPDIYSAVALSLCVKKHYEINRPLTIAGVCKTSTTAENFIGKHSGSLEDIPHLKNRKDYQWSRLVPRFYSTNTIWAESGVKAIEEIQSAHLLQLFNIYYLLTQSVINNYKFIPKIMREEMINFRRSLGINKVSFFLKFIFYLNLIAVKKLLRIFRSKKKEISLQKENVLDIHDCIKVTINFKRIKS